MMCQLFKEHPVTGVDHKGEINARTPTRDIISFGAGADYTLVDLNDTKNPLRFGLKQISTGQLVPFEKAGEISLPANRVGWCNADPSRSDQSFFKHCSCIIDGYYGPACNIRVNQYCPNQVRVEHCSRPDLMILVVQNNLMFILTEA
jgi:hypothetical protein